jgi:type II secretory pathway component PulM
LSEASFQDVVARLEPSARAVFAESRQNLPEVATKAGEMQKHLAEAADLAKAGFREDAHNRYDAALVAAAAALMALVGARLQHAAKGQKQLALVFAAR